MAICYVAKGQLERIKPLFEELFDEGQKPVIPPAGLEAARKDIKLGSLEKQGRLQEAQAYDKIKANIKSSRGRRAV